MIATRDGHEQDVLQSLAMISFSIGLKNGYTEQAFEIIADETRDQIRLLTNNPETYGQLLRLSSTVRSTRSTTWRRRVNRNYAVIVRTSSCGGSESPVSRFVCGGCEAPGTAATGVYLKNHWKDLVSSLTDELCGKDLNKHSLAVLLRFWGNKVESAKIRAETLCFFNRTRVRVLQVPGSGTPKKKLPERPSPSGRPPVPNPVPAVNVGNPETTERPRPGRTRRVRPQGLPAAAMPPKGRREASTGLEHE